MVMQPYTHGHISRCLHLVRKHRDLSLGAIVNQVKKLYFSRVLEVSRSLTQETFQSIRQSPAGMISFFLSETPRNSAALLATWALLFSPRRPY
jgi:hypothetical protein